MLKEELEQQNNHRLTKDNQKIQGFDKFDHSCFVGGTLVHAERGLVQIQDIQIGERVLSADPITGQQSYQAVTKVIKTENQRVIFMEFEYQLEPELSLFEKLKLAKEIRAKFGLERIGLPSVQFMVTPEHPFWVEDKGWVIANQLTTEDIVVDKDGNQYTAVAAGYNAKAQANIYKINQSNYGLMPYYGSEDRFDAVLVDLIKGIEIDEIVKDHPTLNKLYSKNTHWKEDLLAQLPEEDRANAHFHGFSQGDIQWDEGEGYVTTTVYNLEVENTHTYFVGEYGIWVHQCAGAKTNIEH